MKNLRLFLSVACVSLSGFTYAQSFGLAAGQEFHGAEASAICPGSKTVLINKQSNVPSFIIFQNDVNIAAANIFETLRSPLKIQLADGWKLKQADKDALGFTHYRYNQTYAGVKVESGEYLVHESNGRVESVNGMWLDGITLNTIPAITEANALQDAMQFTGAQLYKWQVPEEEAHLKIIKNDVNASWFPKGELVIVCAHNDIFKKDLHLAWKFDVYAAQPVSRKYIYVDAQTGIVVSTLEEIHDADVPSTGTTMYSGTRSFTSDNYSAGNYRLREAARGQGIQTWNCHNSTNTGGATDFTNTSATWTSTANGDNAAYDAHWGAEETYDYYSLMHGRNGLDNAGILMVSYVHYDSGLDNAFWDGTSMQYGDGNTMFNPLVSIDVCGHEFSHGVTQYTCNLNYQNESGAMNESYSDIMGTAIEFYAKPSTANFLIGEEITQAVGTALRNMQNPNQYGDPDTYLGTNWYTGTGDNGGVHTNSGVRNHWFYIECMGEAGTNDIGNTYNVTGLGVGPASDICYRGHSVYLVSTSQYMDCRVADIQSAVDLYGGCSPEHIATTNAWYACGVGAAFSGTVTANFTADVLSSCSVPATINFTNTSSNANTAVWNFGDATTSNVYSPTHVYTAAGTYNVSVTSSSACGTNSITQNAFININPPAVPTSSDVVNCTPTAFTLNATGSGNLNWYTAPTGGSPIATGNSYTTPLLNNTTTYYVDNQVAQAPGNVGPPTNTFGTGGQHNNTSTQYEEFTVYQNCTLATGIVNAGSSGNKTFTLWDNAGVQLSQYTVNVPATGIQTVTLNIPLTPGSYRLGGTSMNLYRNNSGANYPYSLAGVIDITGSSAGSGFYYYLYNWTINLQACTSGRTPVVCTIGPANVSLVTAPYDTVCVNDPAFTLSGGSPAGGTYSGPGVSSGIFNPTLAGAGLQTIVYTYTDVNNCTGSSSSNVFVDVCTTGIHAPDAAAQILVYPNPASDNMSVEISIGAPQMVEVNLINMLGQIVYTSNSLQASGKTILNINTQSSPRGIYLLQVKTSSGMQVKKVELQ